MAKDASAKGFNSEQQLVGKPQTRRSRNRQAMRSLLSRKQNQSHQKHRQKFISLQDFSTRFLVEDGSSVASRDLPRRYQLLEATEDAIAKIDQQKQKQELVEKLEKVNFGKLPLKALQQINQIIEESKNA